MLPENTTAVIARNELWEEHATTEPFEAGWAHEVVIFVRALKEPVGAQPKAKVEISPDGIHWIPEGTEFELPAGKDAITCARISHFGNWLRVAAELEHGSNTTVLVTLHLKA